MRLRLQAKPGEFRQKGRALVRAVAGALAREDADLSDALQKAALPPPGPEMKFPVLAQIDLTGAYQTQMRAMLKDIGKVLDQTVTQVAKSAAPYDFTEDAAEQDLQLFNRIVTALYERGYQPADFLPGGSLYSLTADQLRDMIKVAPSTI